MKFFLPVAIISCLFVSLSFPSPAKAVGNIFVDDFETAGWNDPVGPQQALRFFTSSALPSDGGAGLYCGIQEITSERAHSGSRSHKAEITDTSCSSYPSGVTMRFYPAYYAFGVGGPPILVTMWVYIDTANWTLARGGRLSLHTVSDGSAGAAKPLYTTQIQADRSMSLSWVTEDAGYPRKNVQVPLDQWFLTSTFIDENNRVALWVGDELVSQGQFLASQMGGPIDNVSMVHLGLYGDNNGPIKLYQDDVKIVAVNDRAEAEAFVQAEFGTSTLPPSAIGDVNGDGAVNVSDLGILLSQWNADGSGDLNGDNRVDVIDLGILLANWT